MASKSQEEQLLSPVSTSRGDSASTVNSATRGVPTWLKKVLAEDLEEKGGPHQFGVSKPHSLADIFEADESYQNYERQVTNLLTYWKKYNVAEYKEKVLRKYGITPYRERNKRQQQKNKSNKPAQDVIIDQLSKEVQSRLNLDWSYSEDEADEFEEQAAKKSSSRKTTRSRAKKVEESPAALPKPRAIFPTTNKKMSSGAGGVSSSIVVNSDGTVVGTYMLMINEWDSSSYLRFANCSLFALSYPAL